MKKFDDLFILVEEGRNYSKLMNFLLYAKLKPIVTTYNPANILISKMNDLIPILPNNKIVFIGDISDEVYGYCSNIKGKNTEMTVFTASTVTEKTIPVVKTEYGMEVDSFINEFYPIEHPSLTSHDSIYISFDEDSSTFRPVKLIEWTDNIGLWVSTMSTECKSYVSSKSIENTKYDAAMCIDVSNFTVHVYSKYGLAERILKEEFDCGEIIANPKEGVILLPYDVFHELLEFYMDSLRL